MELVKREMQTCVNGMLITHQFHLDEDVNVPDMKEDVVTIMQADGRMYIDHVTRLEQYVKVSGTLCYQVLYATDNEEQRTNCMEGKIPIEEMIYVEGGEGTQYRVECNQIDFQANVIHSRKLSLKSMIEMQLQAYRIAMDEISVDVESELPIYKRQKTLPMLEMASSKKDTYRIKEEVRLPATKENIGQILMSKIGCTKLETRNGQDEIAFHGEFQFFCMYISDEWKEDWVSQTVEFDGRIECFGLDDSMYHTLRWNIGELSVEQHMDEDGENRILSIEATMKMDIDVYREQEVELLEDLYALEQNCVLEQREVEMESLVLQNQSKCKLVEVIGLPELKDELLQICDCSGNIQVEKITRVDSGLLVDGILHVNFLYVKGDDNESYGSWRGMIPFSHEIECPMNAEIIYDIESNLEQLSITMASNEEAEIKAILCFATFVRARQMISVIDRAELSPFTRSELENQAGIVGYIYKQNDDLWSLAKRYHTTVSGILEINNLEEKDVKTGQKLLIFKESISII